MQGSLREHLRPRRLNAPLAGVISAAALLVACGGHAARAVSEASAAPLAHGAALTEGDWPRFGYDAQRSGVGPANTGITAGNLGALQTRVVRVDGTVDSSPIELHNIVVAGRARDVVVLSTTLGRTIALDPGSGARLWEYVPGDITYQGSSQITTASPISDPDRRFVYASSPDGRIHKLVLATGREVRSAHWPVRVTFDATREKIAAALNLSGSSVIVTTGGYYGDAPTYEGHVAMIDRASGHITAVWNADCSDRHHLLAPPSACRAATTFGGSAIWARAGAVVEPGSRRLLVATGNGPFNGSTDWGDSVLELSAGASRLLHNWTPANQRQLNASDTDLGSTAPAILPGPRGYRLAVQGGKDGQLHLLDLNRLNGTAGGAGRRTGGELQDIGAPGGGEVLTAPAAWSYRGRVYVFVADGSGTAAYWLSTRGRPHLVTAWQNSSAGTSPILAGGLLYVYDEQGGALRIYSPTRGRLLRSLPAARGHWSSPIAVGGRVVLPTGGSTANNAPSSRVFIYHLPGR